MFSNERISHLSTLLIALQRHSISIITAGRDLMACAQTGTYKVLKNLDQHLQFLIPIAFY